MEILPILFWVLAVLAALSCAWERTRPYGVPFVLALIIFLGLRTFPVSWH